ncbi:hypothetical protein DPX16_15346 [Anabarilius grahami]|uniref:Uncharacterized protein n=1 Tax=Anabarilius grahami TaxID=495550 RepID=A0A3N0XVS2_ANAGA|nr:hypothetical protein DPX16_15346 [Anabarilius grahami]
MFIHDKSSETCKVTTCQELPASHSSLTLISSDRWEELAAEQVSIRAAAGLTLSHKTTGKPDKLFLQVIDSQPMPRHNKGVLLLPLGYNRQVFRPLRQRRAGISVRAGLRNEERQVCGRPLAPLRPLTGPMLGREVAVPLHTAIYLNFSLLGIPGSNST